MKKYQFTVKDVDDKKARRIIGTWREKAKHGQIKSFSYKKLPSRYSDVIDLQMTVAEK